nr:PREDICTED: uncharacterized protein LOC107829688 [Nicotiana tabacum]
MGELEMGKGLNQELGLVRAGDSLWGSYYKSFENFILLFESIIDVLDTLVQDARTLNERAKASAKRKLQTLRVDGWDPLKDKVSIFCIKHDILIPNFDEPNANYGISRRKVVNHTTLDHYRVDVFFKIIDWQLQELNDSFSEGTNDLFQGVACLNPVVSFSNFDIRKMVKMDKLYPDDFDEFSLGVLENELANNIIDVRDIDERNVGELNFNEEIYLKKKCSRS